MLVTSDLESSRKSFIQAMILAPHDKRIISNFNTLLQDCDFMGNRSRNAYEEYLQSIQKNKVLPYSSSLRSKKIILHA